MEWGQKAEFGMEVEMGVYLPDDKKKATTTTKTNPKTTTTTQFFFGPVY